MTTIPWLEYQPWRSQFAEICDPRRYPIEWLDRCIIDDRVRLYTCPEAALVVELRHYPTGAFDGHVLIAAGDAGAIVNTLRPRAEQWLRDIGALGAIVESREGWERVLKPEGYQRFQVVMRKQLS